MKQLAMTGLVCFIFLCGCGTVQSTGSDAGSLDGAVLIVDGGREDGGRDIDASGPECPIGAICEANVNYAFVTSTTIEPGALGGLAQGDSLCNSLAMQAGLPGQYRAWLSSSSVNARDRLGQANGWIRPDGRPIALSRDALLAGQIIHPLNLNENGFETTGTIPTATGTDGVKSGATCGDWTDTSANVINGLSNSSDGSWTDERTSSCGVLQSLYCFGIDHDNPLSTPPAASGRLAWVSEAMVLGNFSRDAMDIACNEEGIAQGLSGAFAFVAATGESAISRFDDTGATWVRADGVVLWEQASDVAMKKGPLAPIRFHADGTVPLNKRVWSGAASPDVVAAAGGIRNCVDWSFVSLSTTIGAVVGNSSLNGAEFFDEFPTVCGEATSFYCFER